MHRSVNAVVISLALLLLLGTACGEGIRPEWNIGDKWVMRGVEDGVLYTLTMEITGTGTEDGRPVYLATYVFDPQEIDVNIAKMDKATFRTISSELSGEIQGIPWTGETTITYDTAGDSDGIGEEYELTTTSTSTITVMGETETTTETTTVVIRTEGIENVTVPAGTFKASKTVEYDQSGKAVFSRWAADQVKGTVKSFDHENEVTYELVSYSLSDGMGSSSN